MGAVLSLCSDPLIKQKEFIIKRHYITSERKNYNQTNKNRDNNVHINF